MTLLQLEVPLVALSPMKATLTVPQPLEVVPPPAAKSATGTELKHWTVVFAGQLIVGPMQAEMAKVSVKLVRDVFVPSSCVPGDTPRITKSSSSEGDSGKVT